MVLQWMVRGLRRALAEPRLALLLWCANLLAGLVVALPLAGLLISSLPDAPEGDRLLAGFSFGIVHDLVIGEAGLGGAWAPVLAAVAVLALAGNALLSGGVLECLLVPDDRRFAHRFGRGAGRFFGRFLRVGAVAAPVALLAGGLVAAAFGGLGGRFEESAWEGAELAVRAAGAVVASLVLSLVLVALDLARIEIVRSDSRRVVRLFFRRLGAVLRRPWAPLGLWLANLVLLGLVFAVYLAYRQQVSAVGVAGIGAMIVAQQLVVLSRAGLRVALWAGEAELAAARWPTVPTPRVEPRRNPEPTAETAAASWTNEGGSAGARNADEPVSADPASSEAPEIADRDDRSPRGD